MAMYSHMCCFMPKITWVEIERQSKFVQILPHMWVDLDMAGQHLEILIIKSKHFLNRRFYSLRVIISYYLSHFITLFIAIMDFVLWGGFGQVIWGGYKVMDTVQIFSKCPIPPWKVSKSSLIFFVQMHPTAWKSINSPIPEQWDICHK